MFMFMRVQKSGREGGKDIKLELTSYVRAWWRDEVQSQTWISQHSCQAILQPRLAVGIQPETEADEVGQGSALHTVNIHVRGEEEDTNTYKDIGHYRGLMESEWWWLEDGEEYFSCSSFSFAVIGENKRKVQCIIFWVVDEIVLTLLDYGDKTLADVNFHNYLYNLQKAVGTQKRREIASLQYVIQTVC